MLAGLLVISVLMGGVFVAVAVALSLPVWLAILAYPIGGMVGLLAAALAMLMTVPVTAERQVVRNRGSV